MRLEDLNWMDVEEYLEKDDRIILITGATEQHAYLSLLTDILIPSKMALAVAEQESVLIAPPFNFGLSDMFAAFPGTISLSRPSFDAVLTEIVQSLLFHGFTGFLVMNGHGGNSIPHSLEEMRLDGDIRLTWYDWWRGQASADFQAQHNLHLDHANWGENFPFNRVAESPSGEKALVNLGYLEAGQAVRDVLSDGSFGGPYQVDDALMHELFAKVVQEAAQLVRDLAK